MRLGALPLYALLSGGAIALAGVFFVLAYRGTDGGTLAIAVSAFVAFVVQMGAFALARSFARGGQAIAGWGIGAVVCLLTLVVYGILTGIVALPRDPALLSLATFLFLTELIEPPLLTR